MSPFPRKAPHLCFPFLLPAVLCLGLPSFLSRDTILLWRALPRRCPAPGASPSLPLLAKHSRSPLWEVGGRVGWFIDCGKHCLHLPAPPGTDSACGPQHKGLLITKPGAVTSPRSPPQPTHCSPAFAPRFPGPDDLRQPGVPWIPNLPHLRINSSVTPY